MSIAQQPESRGGLPFSTGVSVSRAGYRADAIYTSTMSYYDNQRQDSFGRTESEQQFRTGVQR